MTPLRAGNAMIAVLVHDSQRVAGFGRYLAEILRGEGLSHHDVLPIDTGLPDLAGYDAVVLTRLNPTVAQVQAMSRSAKISSSAGTTSRTPRMLGP